jgi:hypothetical protein
VSPRLARSLAWGTVAVVAMLGVVLLVFSVLNLSTPEVPASSSLLFNVVALFPGLAAPVVGALIVTRNPSHPVGWMFCAAGILMPLTGVAEGYGIYALFTNPGSLPGGDVAACISVWAFLPALILIGPVLFMVFPDGRPLSPRWRPLLWVAIASMVAVSLGQCLHPGKLDTAPFESVENPFGIAGAGDFLAAVVSLGFLGVVVSAVGAAASILIRFRRSRGVVRLQVKWLAYTGVVFALTMLLSSVLFELGFEDAGNVPVLLTLASIPLCAGQAILRHNLYDVDVVINRTLVYVALTGTLAAAYLGCVLLLQFALDPLTSGSSLAVAMSTLAVAALFRPARARIQGAVDRRFYRRKYDAQHTLESFSARLREQVDLDALGGELRSVVADTMQPAHVSLWLREAER